MPTITVIVPAYNADKFLELTVSSVIDQIFTDWELIIVDDGSNDSTAEIARAFCAKDERIRLLSKSNGGVSSARNAGLDTANGCSRYIIFLDADDIWEPSCLETLYQAAEDDPQFVGAVGRIRLIDEYGSSISTPMRTDTLEAIREALIDGRLVVIGPEKPTTFASLVVSGSIWTPGSILIRMDSIRKTGGFDSSFRTAEDHDLWLRLSRLGDIRFVNQYVIQYRFHQNMKSGNRKNNLRAQRRALQKTSRSADLTREQAIMIVRSYRAAELRSASKRLQCIGISLRSRKLKESGSEFRLFLGALLRSIAGPKNLTMFEGLVGNGTQNGTNSSPRRNLL